VIVWLVPVESSVRASQLVPGRFWTIAPPKLWATWIGSAP
jgi:hypothetical protein